MDLFLYLLPLVRGQDIPVTYSLCFSHFGKLFKRFSFESHIVLPHFLQPIPLAVSTCLKNVPSSFEELPQRVVFEVILDILHILVQVELLIQLGVQGHLVGSYPEVVVVDYVILVRHEELRDANRD